MHGSWGLWARLTDGPRWFRAGSTHRFRWFGADSTHGSWWLGASLSHGPRWFGHRLNELARFGLYDLGGLRLVVHGKSWLNNHVYVLDG